MSGVLIDDRFARWVLLVLGRLLVEGVYVSLRTEIAARSVGDRTLGSQILELAPQFCLLAELTLRTQMRVDSADHRALWVEVLKRK